MRNEHVLEGTSGPGATHQHSRPRRRALRHAGRPGRQLDRRGCAGARARTNFTITATDAVTQRRSDVLNITINRPLPLQTASPTHTVAPPVSLTLDLQGPADGAITTDGNIVVSGTTSASRITVDSTYLGVPGASPSPSPVVGASPSRGGHPRPERGAARVAVRLTAADRRLPRTSPSRPPAHSAKRSPLASDDGADDHGVRRRVAPLSETRVITVEPPIASGVQLILTVNGRESWVRARADGVRVPDLGDARPGRDTDDHRAQRDLRACGRAGSLTVTLNGLEIGPLGSGGETGSWIFLPGAGPTPTEDTCQVGQ